MGRVHMERQDLQEVITALFFANLSILHTRKHLFITRTLTNIAHTSCFYCIFLVGTGENEGIEKEESEKS